MLHNGCASFDVGCSDAEAGQVGTLQQVIFKMRLQAAYEGWGGDWGRRLLLITQKYNNMEPEAIEYNAFE